MTFACACGESFDSVKAISTHNRFKKHMTQEQYFWACIDKAAPNGCWLFRGSVNTTGYGLVRWNGRPNTVASRVSWELANGAVPKGLLVLHRCDTPRCVNHGHLFLGTDADNAADCKAKDRNTRGDRSIHAKLTEADVLAIRQEYRRPSYKQSNAKELSRKYGVTVGTIHQAAQGHSWSYLK